VFFLSGPRPIDPYDSWLLFGGEVLSSRGDVPLVLSDQLFYTNSNDPPKAETGRPGWMWNLLGLDLR